MPGLPGRSDEWAVNGNEEGAANLVAFQKVLARNDLSLTHTLIHAMSDKSKGHVPSGFDETQLHTVEKTEHGILVRGARVLATLAPFSDETRGLSQPADAGCQPAACVVVLHSDGHAGAEIHLPRQCVVAGSTGSTIRCPAGSMSRMRSSSSTTWRCRGTGCSVTATCAVYNSVMSASWRANAMHQTMIRAWTKLEFAWGIACRMAEAIGASDPATLQMLGEIWGFAELARSAVLAARGRGVSPRQRRVVPGRAADGCAAHVAALLVPAGE